MPELPEVETTCRGLAPQLIGRRIEAVIVRERRLRWPVPSDLCAQLAGNRVRALRRRAKYLIFELERGAMIVHLGMSGALRIVASNSNPGKHDHLDWLLAGGQVLRYTDPRRFGSVHFVLGDPEQHSLLSALGPEPLAADFDAQTLHRASRARRVSIKEFLMNSRIVAGVGNIYANEALYRAGIDPRTRVGRLSRERYRALVASVRATLNAALAAGGSSLRDWLHADGSSGYFQQQYFVYDRRGEACRRCGTPIREIRQGQRASFFCPRCQRR
jgi:formamidopyrimidine-DNA glycosylase